MSWNITERFPQWGQTGEFPSDGFFYDGETNNTVNEKHLDALWNGIEQFENEVIAALDDIDSDRDGVVDEADSADKLKGNDVVTSNGVAFDAENATSTYKNTDLFVDYVNASDSEIVNDGTSWLLYAGEIQDGETISIYNASFTGGSTDPAPSGTSLELVTWIEGLGYSLRDTILSGDGTFKVDETGNPLASWENDTGATKTYGVLLNNGKIGTSGTGQPESLFGQVIGRLE